MADLPPPPPKEPPSGPRIGLIVGIALLIIVAGLCLVPMLRI